MPNQEVLQVPYTVKVKLGEILERMVIEGNLEKTDCSE